MKKSWFADLILLGVTFVWGATFVLVKQAIQAMPPFTFLAVRFLIAAFALFLFMFFFYRDTLRHLNKQIWLHGTLLGLMLFGGYAFQTFGLEYTSSSKAGFITGLSVVMVPLMTLCLGQRLKRNAVIGVLMATVGLGMMSLSKESGLNFGDMLVFLCAVSYALQIVFVGLYAPKYHAFPLALIQIFTCGVFNAIGAVCFENYRAAFTPAVLFNGWVISSLLICSVIATAFAFVAQNQFQKFTTPTRTGLIFSAEPVFAALAGVIWEGDSLTVAQWVGCALILVGMLVAELGGSHDDPPHEKTVVPRSEPNASAS